MLGSLIENGNEVAEVVADGVAAWESLAVEDVRPHKVRKEFVSSFVAVEPAMNLPVKTTPIPVCDQVLPRRH